MIIGIGVDIVEISRIQKAIERWGDGFLTHVFTTEEIAWAKRHKFPYPHYAGRFAAKEAIFKALGRKEIVWTDLNILGTAQGKPYCQCLKKNVPGRILLTISHSKEYAVAQAIVEE